MGKYGHQSPSPHDNLEVKKGKRDALSFTTHFKDITLEGLQTFQCPLLTDSIHFPELPLEDKPLTCVMEDTRTKTAARSGEGALGRQAKRFFVFIELMVGILARPDAVEKSSFNR